MSADAFRKLSEYFLEAIGRDSMCHERATRDFGGCIASVTNLSLALELYLKALYLLSGFQVPTTHDLWSLFEGLPQSVKSTIIACYKRLPEAAAGIKVLQIQLSVGPLKGDPTFPDHKSDYSLENVLKRSKDAFETWRYLYERGKRDRVLNIAYEFHYLGTIATVLRQTSIDMWQALRTKKRGVGVPQEIVPSPVVDIGIKEESRDSQEQQNREPIERSVVAKAWKLSEEGRLTEAEVEFARSVVGRQRAQPLIEYGRFLRRLGRLDQAAVMFEGAITVAKDQGDKAVLASAYGNLGMILKVSTATEKGGKII